MLRIEFLYFYALATTYNQNQGYGARTRGQTRAGSTLQAGNAQGSVTGAALSGTWMCMGQDLDGSQNGGRATLWFRRS